MPKSTVKARIAPPKPTAIMDMDSKRKEQINRAETAPTVEGSSARRPISGRGKVNKSKKAMPATVRMTAIRMSRRAVFSLSRAAR